MLGLLVLGAIGAIDTQDRIQYETDECVHPRALDFMRCLDVGLVGQGYVLLASCFLKTIYQRMLRFAFVVWPSCWIERTLNWLTVSFFDWGEMEDRSTYSYMAMLRRILEQLNEHNAAHPEDPWLPPAHLWASISLPSHPLCPPIDGLPFSFI